MVHDTEVKRLSNRLEDVWISVATCGGIGAVEVVKIIRELRRHGARVDPFMTPDALRFVTELSIGWAAANRVVTDVGPMAEHLNDYKFLLVVPATFSTISKCALGICDNAVTLTAATHFSRRRPSLFVPAMNATLAEHPLYAKYRAQLSEWGAEFMEEELEEGKMKVPDPTGVANCCLKVWESQCRRV